MPTKSQRSNPVLKTVHGVDVRRYNYVSIQFSEEDYIELIKMAKETGLSIPKIIAFRSQPCQQCGCDSITISIKKNARTNIVDNSQTIISKNAKRHPNTGSHTAA